tara:strand:- start:442 stop:1908 length:1467 start_codon:yes stop_codon:yes gene_type:complete
MSLTKASYSLITGAPINVVDYGADPTGAVDSAAVIQSILNSAPNNTQVFIPVGTYLISSTIVFPATSKNIRLTGYGATFTVGAGRHSCIDLTAESENYGWHTVEGLTIQGPNNYYAISMANSDGAGILIRRTTNNINAAYNTEIRDCNIQGFKYGIRMRNAIKVRVEGKTFIRFNNYGIYIDGWVANANSINDAIISLNDTAGFYSDTVAGSTAQPTNNVISNCLLESNHPYSVTPVFGGIAIYLNNSYDNIFENCYTEDQQYSVYLTGASKGNKFNSCRFAPGSFGNDIILISGADTWDNVFTNCKSAVVSRNTPNVETDNANQLYNQFLDCEGFNFIASSIVKMPYIQNLRPVDYSADLGGAGYVAIPEQGVRNNVFEGTTPGTITGIGTATATLNCFGLGEIQFETAVAAAATNTTITTFSRLQKGQFIVLWNYQNTRSVIIKGSGAFGSIVPKGGIDATMNDYGQQIVFYVNSLGRAYEVGRNF